MILLNLTQTGDLLDADEVPEEALHEAKAQVLRRVEDAEDGGRALVQNMTGATPVWDPYFIETLGGSFSAVSTPQIARVGAFFSIFRDYKLGILLHRSKLKNSV